MQDHSSLPKLTFTVHRQDLPFYTTLLQSGVEIKGSSNETMGHFLGRLPGFTVDYISDTVQTLFLNGSAVDDLTTVLGYGNPVLALSAAMPGLAGAIFRRNSFHAALRTSNENVTTAGKEPETIFVTLKLFNSIALERGAVLLDMGVCVKTLNFSKFLARRGNLFNKVQQIELSNRLVNREDLLTSLAGNKKINLKITTPYG